jgi:hypothetical protein
MTTRNFFSGLKSILVGNNEDGAVPVNNNGNGSDALLNAARSATKSIEDQVAEHLSDVEFQRQQIADETKRQEQVEQARASFVKAQKDLAKAKANLQHVQLLRHSSVKKTASAEDALRQELERWMDNPTVVPTVSNVQDPWASSQPAQPAAPAVETESTVEAPKPPAPKSPKVAFDGTNLADISEADRQALGLG